MCEAGEPIFVRRNTKVANEYDITQSKLVTEIAVEQERRAIRETKLKAEALVKRMRAQSREAELENDITVEGRRQEFVAAEAENTRTCGRSRSASHRRRVECPALNGSENC